MRHSLKVGLSFGLTSGVITTLGLIVGLHSGTHSKLAVIGGILTIAIADALSDALGIHISEESEGRHTTREVWEATLFTLMAKFFFTMSFIIPVFLLSLKVAIIVSVVWGLLLLGIFSFYIAKEQRVSSWIMVFEHIVIALVVITIAHYIGDWVRVTSG